jgi:hypothetical protein
MVPTPELINKVEDAMAGRARWDCLFLILWHRYRDMGTIRYMVSCVLVQNSSFVALVKFLIVSLGASPVGIVFVTIFVSVAVCVYTV